MQANGEPSVEEILDSIKKVIARDNGEGPAPTRRRSPLPEAEPAHPEEAEDVLDLGAPLDESEMALDADDSGAATASADDALLPPHASDAMRRNFAALSMLAQPGQPPQIVRQGETSLEGLTRELLKPMLAEWLERNLPPMVEELVKQEIARIAGKRS